jgi:hypothetical protein
MKLRLVINRTQVETCEIDVPDLDSAKKEIEALTHDDFRQEDHYYNLEIFDGDKDVTGEIQPFTPKLDG